jgi:hypothetical protein
MVVRNIIWAINSIAPQQEWSTPDGNPTHRPAAALAAAHAGGGR